MSQQSSQLAFPQFSFSTSAALPQITSSDRVHDSATTKSTKDIQQSLSAFLSSEESSSSESDRRSRKKREKSRKDGKNIERKSRDRDRRRKESTSKNNKKRKRNEKDGRQRKYDSDSSSGSSSRSRSRERRRKDKDKDKKKQKTNERDEKQRHDQRPTSGNDWRIDRRADMQNLTYGLYKYDIPKFRRDGSKILGMPDRFRIDFEATKKSKNIIVTETGRRGMTHRYTENLLKDDSKTVQIQPRVSMSSKSHASNFIPLPLGDDIYESADSEGDEAEASTSQFSLFPQPTASIKSTPSQPLPSDVALPTTSSTRILERTKDYNQRLQSSPNDVDLWLEFIKFQDEQYRSSSKSSYVDITRGIRGSAGLKTGNVEKKLSIFERALKLNPDNEKLICGYLLCAEDAWQMDTLKSKYREYLSSYPMFYGLWLQYLSFRQTSFSQFTVENCRIVYSECLNMLECVDVESSNVEKIEMLKLQVWLRCVNMLWQSGFHEQAIAIFQLQIEFSWFFPYALEDASEDEIMESLEDFWESELPRFGENDARGWSAFVEGSRDDADSFIPVDFKAVKSNDAFIDFYRLEKAKDCSKWFPLRCTDPDNTLDDPFSCVLYEDIRPFVLTLRSPQAKHHLIFALFERLNINIPVHLPTSHPFRSDSLLQQIDSHSLASYWNNSSPNVPELSSLQDIVSIVDGVPMIPELRNDYLLGDFGVVGKLLEIGSLFSRRRKNGWFRWFDGTEVEDPNMQRFIRNVFNQSAPIAQHLDAMKLLYLSIEFSLNPEKGRSLASTYVEENPDNLFLQYSLCQMLSSNNRVDEARERYTWLLNMMRRSPPDEHKHLIPLLYLSFAEMELELNRPMASLAILTALAEDNVDLAQVIKETDENLKPTPVQILKAKKFYATFSSVNISEIPSTLNSLLLSISLSIYHCRALFEYLSQSISEASTTYENLISSVNPNFIIDTTASIPSLDSLSPISEFSSPSYIPKIITELLYIGYSKLLYRHSINSTIYQPKLLRQVLEQAIDLFPLNTAFWELYFWNESKMKLEMRLRSLCDKVVTRHPSPVLILFLIYSEIHLHKSYNPHVIRSLFEKAVDHPETRHSSLLWIHYLISEIKLQQGDRAKAVLLRGIREVPWCKELYLKAFALDGDEHAGGSWVTGVRKWMSLREETEIYEIMLDKGIRVRTESDL
ncbi:NRDE-2, necessary for RNA interference-domain-containing protein [Paraphysoderma sedebokerense]|nr:NRDE-2, necessary for RNA interference-domain-containing protein [Paraphysoderma sedebokerense]